MVPQLQRLFDGRCQPRMDSAGGQAPQGLLRLLKLLLALGEVALRSTQVLGHRNALFEQPDQARPHRRGRQSLAHNVFAL